MGNLPTKMKAQQRHKKAIMLEVKFKSNVNGVIEEIADRGNVGSSATWESLDMWPKELCEGQLNNINKKSVCDERDKDVSEELKGLKLYIKGTAYWRYFTTFKGTKDKKVGS